MTYSHPLGWTEEQNDAEGERQFQLWRRRQRFWWLRSEKRLRRRWFA